MTTNKPFHIRVSRYNFYGISGVFDDPNDEGRGVLEFKQGFNGYDAKPTYKKFLGYRPGVAVIDDLIVG